MATVFQTMFVPPPSPSTFPHNPKTLPPVETLEQSILCSSYGDPGDVYAQLETQEPSASSAWSPSSLLYPFQLGKILGWRKPDEDLEQCYIDSQPAYSPPRSSVESLRESLTGHASSLPQLSPCQLKPIPATHSLPLNSHTRSRGPFKPQRASKGTSSWQLRQFAEATLGSGSLRKAVKLPEGEDLNEWLAVNVVDFYNQINLLYGSITEFCSPTTCPEMKATDEYEYLWQDSESYKRPTKMPAPEYIEHLMAWCQNNIDNEQLFPSRIGIPFPKTFPALVRQMFKRLYRVYAHIYCHHYPVIIQLGLEPHLNTSFKHYVLFVDEHSLASGKDFWGPLGELVENMLRSD